MANALGKNVHTAGYVFECFDNSTTITSRAKLTFKVTQTGTIEHSHTEERKRQIKGDARKEMAKRMKINRTTVDEEYYGNWKEKANSPRHLLPMLNVSASLHQYPLVSVVINSTMFLNKK